MQNLLYDWTGAGASQRRMRLCATQLARGVVGKSHRRRWGGVLSSSGPLGGGYMECPQIYCRDSSYGYTWTIQPKIEGIKVPPASAQASGGTFMPSIFGWMVHVYPYEESRQKIWGHSMYSSPSARSKKARRPSGADGFSPQHLKPTGWRIAACAAGLRRPPSNRRVDSACSYTSSMNEMSPGPQILKTVWMQILATDH